MSIEILHRDDLPLGGFAGLKEHRLVMSPELFGPHTNPGTWHGLANFVYLADARFNPKGETRMHEHKEVDVVSIMIEGRIDHQGSLEHGQGLYAGDIQIQRAGGEGFSHNEINPDNNKNRMLQLWVLPEEPGQGACYKLYKPATGLVTRIYGGNTVQGHTLASHTIIDYVSFSALQEFVLEKPFLAYLAQGTGSANKQDIVEGDLIKDDHLSFIAKSEVKLIVIYEI